MFPRKRRRSRIAGSADALIRSGSVDGGAIPLAFPGRLNSWRNRMKIPLMCITAIAALLCSFATAQNSQTETSTGEVNLAAVAKIKAGNTTREQIKELLGPPYRMTNYGDCSPIDYQEFWEYLGHDENGIFKIHIEFDEAGIARIVGKDTKKGPIIVLDAAPKPDKQHHHTNAGG